MSGEVGEIHRAKNARWRRGLRYAQNDTRWHLGFEITDEKPNMQRQDPVYKPNLGHPRIGQVPTRHHTERTAG